MGVTRRRFLEIGTLVAASVAVPLQAASQSEFTAVSHMTEDTFKPWVGSVFDVYSGAPRPALVVLEEVKNLATSKGATSPDPRKQCFSLGFRSLPGDALPQGTYIFENSALGRFALFIVPSGPGVAPTHYTAIINRAAR